MIKLYGFPISGHAHKVRLMLSLLGLDFERHEASLGLGEYIALGRLRLQNESIV